jgi:hypothetical protein
MLYLDMAPKTRVTVALSPDLENLLKRQATEENLSVSALVGSYLELAVRTRQDLVASELLGPKLQASITAEVRAMSNRLAQLLVRVALLSGSNKQLLFQLLVKEFGNDKAFSYRDKAWQVSVDELKQPLEGLAEILKLEEDDA